MSILFLTDREYHFIHNERSVPIDPVTYIGSYRLIEIDCENITLIDALASCILQLHETKRLRNILKKQFYFEQEHEIKAILKYARFLLNKGDILEEVALQDIDKCRMQAIREELITYLKTGEYLHLEGFFHFRLQYIWRSYPQIIENAIDEYMMEKEYRDYISYLRGLVRNRPSQISSIHLLVPKEHQYILLDDFGKEVDFEEFRNHGIYSELEHPIYDDQMISTLIALNPRQILYHSQQLEHHVVQSLYNIFEERFSTCSGCSLCRERLENRG